MASNKTRRKHSQDHDAEQASSTEKSGKNADQKPGKTDGKRHAGKHHAGKFSSAPRPFWTGIVSFGLVALPVSLYAASRGKPSLLNMVDTSGTRLNRRYLCSKDKTMLSAKDIVRGYEVDKDQYVTVDDDELEALAPEKSNEIDLQRFVDLDQIDPIYFEKGYFLAPEAGAIKAYRLLAESMEQENRAGIATFVMRDREYLVAIVSEAGILRAETLRFHDEVRAPVEVGLAGIENEKREDDALAKLADKMLNTFESMTTDELDRSKLEDQQTARIKEKVQQKLEKNEDIIAEKPSKARAEELPQESAEVVDLMELIKARMRGEKLEAEEAEKEKPAKPRKTTGVNGKNGSSADKARSVHQPSKKNQPSNKNKKQGAHAAAAKEKLMHMTRDELYERAQALDISGRSKMSKQQLVEALPPQ